MVKKLPKIYSTKCEVSCENKFKNEVILSVINSVSNTEIDLTDGVKIFFDNGWVLLRPSGTEPKFRIYSESTSKEDTKARSDYYCKLIVDYIKTVRG